jgi:uncharacterized protein (TIGR01777 family)
MNIAISGASGFIGRHLTAYFTERGHRVIPLARPMFREGMLGYLTQALSHCDVVINLAGAPISKRWTPEHKRELYDSRIRVTHRIISALNAVRTKPKVLISASAVGIYPTEGDSDEYTNTRGGGFLADLCYAWEKEARRCPSQTRLVITRFGIVISPDGGAMVQMLRPLKLAKIGTAIGPGTQPFPWIDIRDLCRAMDFIIHNESVSGVVNLVAPQQVSQWAFTKAMSKAYNAGLTLIVPKFVFRFMYGEAASFLTTGPSVRPTRLKEMNFRFETPTLEKLFSGTDRTTVDELDLKRYLGRWYEIARYDHRFERGMSEVTATYTLLPNGTLRVENEGVRNEEGKKIHKKAIGKAYVPDPAFPGRLKVSFFLWFYSDYYVLELDTVGYNYALIGSRSDKYLWILSRTPHLPEDIKKKLLHAAAQRGYDTGKLMWIEQI